jgi:hypothetical protein
MLNSDSLRLCTVEDIEAITLESANAKDKIIRIFEVGSLDSVVGLERAEICRQEFLKNKIQIKQLSNKKVLEKFTTNNEFVDKYWQAHFIESEKFEIKTETLIYDDKVVFYTVHKPFKMLKIEDKQIAYNYKQMFDSVWNNSMAPNLSFPKTTAGLYFLPHEEMFGKMKATVYPDAGLASAYKPEDYSELLKRIISLLKDEYYADASRIIVIAWANGDKQMMDVWKFSENYVDFTSGDLADVKIYEGSKEVTNIGRASSNTLVILGFEEKNYRMKLQKNFNDLPAGFLINKEFFV